MLRDYAEKYLEGWSDGKFTYNCSEATLRACNDCYDLGLGEDTLKMAAGFGGGMYTGEICGVVTGGTAALSLIFGSGEPPYINEKLMERVQTYQTSFTKEFTSTNCAIIRNTDEVQQKSCTYAVLKGCDILEEVFGKDK